MPRRTQRSVYAPVGLSALLAAFALLCYGFLLPSYPLSLSKLSHRVHSAARAPPPRPRAPATRALSKDPPVPGPEHQKGAPAAVPGTPTAPAMALSPDQVRKDCDAILGLGTRVAGSASHGHNATRALIVERLRGLGWSVEVDSFRDNTVLGPRDFHNIIAMWSPRRRRGGGAQAEAGPEGQRAAPWLLLAAHYDSKLYENGEFLGAIDSVASCAMLLDIAANITRNASLAVSAQDPPDLKFVFFDGEEAFKDWTVTDSVYGARHLAAKWQREGLLPNVELFVLLDLLGSRDTPLSSLHSRTHPYFEKLTVFERQYREQGLIKCASPHFKEGPVHPFGYRIQDDHTPFLQRQVPILHLIPSPFPRVWHTFNDNRQALHWDTIYDLTLVLTRFVTAYVAAPVAS